MKLAIVGYGKMGRLIEQLAPECGFTMHAHIDVGDEIAKASGADVAIEFTTPEAAAGNIEKLAAMKVAPSWSALPAGSTSASVSKRRSNATKRALSGARIFRSA